jgi:hypothetical protein
MKRPITIDDLKAYLVYCDKAEVPADWPKPVRFEASLRSFYFWLEGTPIEIPTPSPQEEK